MILCYFKLDNIIITLQNTKLKCSMSGENALDILDALKRILTGDKTKQESFLQF